MGRIFPEWRLISTKSVSETSLPGDGGFTFAGAAVFPNFQAFMLNLLLPTGSGSGTGAFGIPGPSVSGFYARV